MQQNSLTRDRRFATPERLGESAVDKTNGLRLSSPFPRRPSPGEIAQKKLQQRAIPMRIRVVRIDGDRATEARQCFIEPAQFGEGRATVIECQREALIELYRSIEIDQGLGISSETLQHQADIVGDVGVAGCKFARLHAVDQGTFEPLQTKLADSLQMKRTGLCRVYRKRPL